MDKKFWRQGFTRHVAARTPLLDQEQYERKAIHWTFAELSLHWPATRVTPLAGWAKDSVSSTVQQLQAEDWDRVLPGVVHYLHKYKE